MISLRVVNPSGQQVSTIEVDPAEFGGKVNKQLLHDVVVMHLANRRVGTHSTKGRGEVAGSGKKLFRQKGTGNARVGTKRTNKRKGGGTAKGPKPRDYSYTMPKRQRRLATRMALLSRFEDDETVVIDGLNVAEPKTKQIAGVLKTLGLAGKTCLVATDGVDRNLYLAARNIDGMEIMPAQQLHAYAVLRPKRLILTTSALAALRRQATEAEAENVNG